MKKIITTITLAIIIFAASAQTNSSFLRHDTTLLSSPECNWLIPPQLKTSTITKEEFGNTVTGYFVQSIKKGKLKAVDPISEKPIPANKILNWNMPADTVAVYD